MAQLGELAQRVSTRLLCCFLAYVLLLGAMVSATVVVLNRQHTDGLSINLAGRQRMLSQRMTHQLLGFAREVEQRADDPLQVEARPGARERRNEAAQRVRSTMDVFESTLLALLGGGSAPVDLRMTSFRKVPAASAAVAPRLRAARALYQRYRKGAEAVLQAAAPSSARVEAGPRAREQREAGLATILALESTLLAECDAAVVVLQAEAEAKVINLFVLEGAALAMAVILTFVLMRWTRASLITPLEQLRSAAEALSLGDLQHTVPSQGTAELRSLSESFERMRTSVRALLEMERHRNRVSVEIADW